jgi:RNA polymerase sigma-70 factor (ECF subfamily)
MSVNQQHDFEAHRPSVYHWAARILGKHHDAMDVTQDVCLRWLALTPETMPQNPRGWLRTVTVNRALDMTRKYASTSDATQARLHEGTRQEPSPDRLASQAETRTRVQDALVRLSPQQRAVLIAKVFDGETFAQIASDLGISIPTAKTHYLRALETLEPELRDLVSG